VTAGTGTLATALRGETSAATGTLASAVLNRVWSSNYVTRAQATQDMASVQWVVDQGYGSGGGSGTPTRVEAGSNVTVQASVDGGTNVFTVNASAGGGSGTMDHVSLTNQNGNTNFLHLTAAEKAIATTPYVLPTNLAAVTFSISTEVDNTDVLVLSHANPGAGPNMAGAYTWDSENNGYGSPSSVFVRMEGGVWICGNSEAQWESTSTVANATYVPDEPPLNEAAEGTITATYAKQSAAPFADATGLHGNGSDITGLTAGQVGAVSNTPAGIKSAGGLTNIVTATTNLPAGTLVYGADGKLYGGTNDATGGGVSDGITNNQTGVTLAGTFSGTLNHPFAWYTLSGNQALAGSLTTLSWATALYDNVTMAPSAGVFTMPASYPGKWLVTSQAQAVCTNGYYATVYIHEITPNGATNLIGFNRFSSAFTVAHSPCANALVIYTGGVHKVYSSAFWNQSGAIVSASRESSYIKLEYVTP
jgi:hypothetical protein